VQHNLDTAALNKNINFEQCQNSYSGCYFCRKCRGKYYNDFGKHIYQGHRGLLPFNHVLRKYDQARKERKEKKEKRNLSKKRKRHTKTTH
jgi:hypothetical protein